MSTRSFIGKVQEDGNVRSVYCHHDGYPSCVGAILDKHYVDPAKIDELLDGGDMSALGTEIGPEHDFDDHANRPEGATTFYRRDRGEEDVDASIATKEEFVKLDEIRYLFEDGQWFTIQGYEDRELVLLSKVLADDPEVT